jgi:hypothetical protein
MDLFEGLSDIATTTDGDIIIEGGDLKQVRGVDWFIQEVNKILRSSNDWAFAPNAGADLGQFLGATNTRSTATEIEETIKDKIKYQGIHFPAELTVKVVPLNINEIKLFINLKYENQIISVSKLIFNMQQGNMRSIEESETRQNTRATSKHPFVNHNFMS